MGLLLPRDVQRKWQSPGCRECLSISVNHPLQLPKDSSKVLQTYT